MTVASEAGLTTRLAQRSSALTGADLPPAVVTVARHGLLDWFGVTLGGIGEDGPQILMQALTPANRDDAGAVSIVGRLDRYRPLDAALINGTASHRLDFDDVSARFIGHVSVAVLAAALALAEHRDASVAELLGAYVAGYETACRIAAAVGPQPYLRGWHSTGTIGTFGAAAACARLLELDGDQTATALGLAASQAAGIKANIGTMTKSLHAGKACQNGLLSALLAARGFSANPDAIEASQGFGELAGGDCDVAAALADPPSGFWVSDTLFKYHASCFMTHSMLDGIGELLTRSGVPADAVRRIDVHVSELELGACAIPEPRDGLEVKFSLAHLAAMALLGRSTAEITDTDATDPQLITARERLVCVAGDGVAGTPTRVELSLADGKTLTAAVDVNAPARDLTLQGERLSAKFTALATAVLGGDRAAQLRDAILGPVALDSVRELLALAR